MTLRLDHPTMLDMLGLLFTLDEDESEQLGALGNTGIDHETMAMAFYTSPGPKICMRDEEGKAAVVTGIRRARNGVGETWFFTAPGAWKKHGREITERMIELRKDMMGSGWHRLETYCLASRDRARRWYDTIGLTYETTLRQYGANGEDFVLYVTVKEPTGD